jgi:fructose-1-phosphate kinase PfkB-like protein
VDFLPYAETVFINAAEFGVLCTAYDPHQSPAIVVSNGPHLATLLRHGHVTATAQPPQAAVSEVTGAGDTLAGTFLAVAAAGLSDADALDAAVNAATRAAGSPGVAISGQ